MTKKLLITGLLVIGMLMVTPADNRYRYSMETRAHSHGTILLFIKYRIYFQGYAEIDLLREPLDKNRVRFRFEGVSQSGHMARTLGFAGRKLGIFTANPADRNFAEVSTRIKESILNTQPYYAAFINKTILYPYHIREGTRQGNGFIRTTGGVQSHSRITVPIDYSSPDVEIRTYFKIYDILAKSLEFYNHSYLPQETSDPGTLSVGQSWESREIDYTDLLNATLIKAARIMEMILPFRQSAPFRVIYTVTDKKSDSILIRGRAVPGVSLWRDYLIRSFHRDILFDLPGNRVVSDRCQVDIYNGEGMGGFARAELRLIPTERTASRFP